STAGIEVPVTSRMVAATSMACTYCGRIAPRSGVAGQRTIRGSPMPPSCLVRLQAPEGRVARERPSPRIVAVGSHTPQVVEHRARALDVVREAVEDEVLVERAV